MKLLLFYLSDPHRHYTFTPFVNLLSESKYADKFQIIILSHEDDLSFYKSILDSTNIQHKEFNITVHDNYLEKVKFAIQYAKNNNFSYMLKCDNDLFLRGRTLDFMIDNLYLLEDTKNLTLGPTVSSGIPCVEYFMNDFLNDEERSVLCNKFLQTEFKNMWGATYTHLNEFTLNSSSWDGAAFFSAIKQNEHYYKGIHPIRVNLDAMNYLNSCIVRKKEKFLQENRDMSIISDNISPYLCNSIFCIKTSTYETIVYDRSLYVDTFDEVPLNKYAWNTKSSHLFVKNGYCIHMYYNTIESNRTYERTFCNNFFSKSLSSLVDNTKTDKNTCHSYLDLYQSLLCNKKDTAKNVLEVGIFKGGSIKLWNDFFTNATIYGLDILNSQSDWEYLKNDKIVLYASTNAYDENFFKTEFLDRNIRCDVMVDDGPHTLESMKQFIKLYSQIMTDDGILIIEDIQSFEWIEILKNEVPSHLKKFIKTYDLRHVKNRWDDIVFTIDKFNISTL